MICAEHQKEMRQNSRGWYCPTKVGNGWCQYGQSREVRPPEPTTGELVLDEVRQLRKVADAILKAVNGTQPKLYHTDDENLNKELDALAQAEKAKQVPF